MCRLKPRAAACKCNILLLVDRRLCVPARVPDTTNQPRGTDRCSDDGEAQAGDDGRECERGQVLGVVCVRALRAVELILGRVLGGL